MNANPTSRTARKQIVSALIIAGVQIGGALLLTFVRQQGMIDGETVTRGVMVLIGLSLAFYGNTMPKMLDAPPRSVREATAAQSVLRVGGWAMTLSGLAFAALWAFAPRGGAEIASVAIVAAGVAFMLGYAVRTGIVSRTSTSE
jgi:hypothetical protein